MKFRVLFSLAASLIILAACGGGTNAPRAVPTGPAINDDGSTVTDVLTAQFNPSTLEVPLPINLLFSGSTDLTLNTDSVVVDPTDGSDPFVVLNAMDGFSTVAPWAANFVGRSVGGEFLPVTLDAASVVHGSSVRVFEVTTVFGTIAPNGIVKELAPGADFVAVLGGPATIAILPTQPLKELTTYMAVITDDVKDTAGNDATPDSAYFITKRTEPLVDIEGNSTDPNLDNATANALEPLRQITNAQEAVAAAAGIDPAEIVVSWTVTTQSITPVLGILRSTVQPAPVALGPTGATTALIGGAGIADIWAGIITLPYYLEPPTAANPIGPLNGFWKASPGAYIPPFDSFGFDPTSTNITVANPLPVVNDMQTVPVILTVPNIMPKPASGWPVVIFQHGITRNRTDALAIADTMAFQGFAVIAIDMPLHGVVPAVQPQLAPFWIEAHPVFGGLANERTFEVDYVSNTSGAPGADMITDASGTHTINLASLLTSRDNLRQATIDLSVLASSIFAGIDLDGDNNPDLNGANINFVGTSLGAMVGTAFLAIDPLVNNALLNVPGGAIAEMLNASATFGPRIRAGLAAAGVEPGSPEFAQFFLVAQTAIDSADPINWGALAAAGNSILLHEVIDDAVIPNFSPVAPLAGTEPLIRIMGLPVINSTTADPGGIRAAVRFLPPATHGSLLDPTDSPLSTVEMQSQMASMMATGGTTVVVSDPSVIATE